MPDRISFCLLAAQKLIYGLNQADLGHASAGATAAPGTKILIIFLNGILKFSIIAVPLARVPAGPEIFSG